MLKQTLDKHTHALLLCFSNNRAYVLFKCSDVCLEAEASLRGSLEAENLLPRPRLDVLMPRLGLASPCGYCLVLATASFLLLRLDLMLRHRRSEPLIKLRNLRYVTRS